MCRREPSLCEGDSIQHRVSSDKLKILLQPPRGCCLDRQVWQGWLLLRDLLFHSVAAKRPEGHGEKRVPQLREGDEAHAGGPQYFPAVSQLFCTFPGRSRSCSSSAGGALPAPLRAQGLRLGHTQVLAEGPGWAVGHGEGTMGCCWRRKPPKWLTWGPPAPSATTSLQDTASRLLPLHSLVTTFCCVT